MVHCLIRLLVDSGVRLFELELRYHEYEHECRVSPMLNYDNADLANTAKDYYTQTAGIGTTGR